MFAAIGASVSILDGFAVECMLERALDLSAEVVVGLGLSVGTFGGGLLALA